MPLGFLGEYEYRVDGKGRIPLPPPFREKLGESVVVARGPEKCIRVYPAAEWERRTEQLDSRPDELAEVREDLRLKYALSREVEVDKQNRIALPPNFRQFAEIRDVAVVTGVGKYVEIWGQEQWEAERDSLLKRAA